MASPWEPLILNPESFLRRRLWLNFHLWTILLVATLSVANGVLAVRPITGTNTSRVASAHSSLFQSVQLLAGHAKRAPANESASDMARFSTPGLKTTLLGCENSLELRVAENIRQLRLQIETCVEQNPTESAAVLKIENQTNGFEATVFGNAAPVIAATEMKDGTFTAAEDKTRSPSSESTPKVASVTSANQGPVSTDYITLAPGQNTILIHRGDRIQTLKVERK